MGNVSVRLGELLAKPNSRQTVFVQGCCFAKAKGGEDALDWHWGSGSFATTALLGRSCQGDLFYRTPTISPFRPLLIPTICLDATWGNVPDLKCRT